MVLYERLLHTFCHTAEHTDDLRMPRVSTLPIEIVQSMYDTLLRIITHRAGIDEYGVRLIDLIGELIARQLHLRSYDLAVSHIHLTAFVPLLTLSHSVGMLWAGMALMGVVLGAHETVMRSAIADITPFSKRGIGFGIFNTIYGLSLLFGSFLMGWLYDLEQQPIIVAMTILSEGAAVALYVVLYKRIQRERLSN